MILASILALAITVASGYALACGGGSGGGGGGGEGADGGEDGAAAEEIGGSGSATSLGVVLSLPPMAISNMTATATAHSTTEAAGGTGCTYRLECDPWLKQQFKLALRGLLSDYYTAGLGDAAAGPDQVEILSELAAKLVAYEL